MTCLEVDSREIVPPSQFFYQHLQELVTQWKQPGRPPAMSHPCPTCVHLRLGLCCYPSATSKWFPSPELLPAGCAEMRKLLPLLHWLLHAPWHGCRTAVSTCWYFWGVWSEDTAAQLYWHGHLTALLLDQRWVNAWGSAASKCHWLLTP